MNEAEPTDDELRDITKRMRAELWVNWHKGDPAGWRSLTLRQSRVGHPSNTGSKP